MSLKQIEFNPNGGPLTAKIECGFAHTGAYSMILWEANVNQTVFVEKGNFINPDDDSYFLPDPTNAHHERIIESVGNVVMLPGVDDYHVALIVEQDAVELDRVVMEGTGDGVVPFDLFAMLVEAS